MSGVSKSIMTVDSNNTNHHTKGQKQVAIWLLAGVVMVVIQILLGGITRLTGSGLSITEWKPILGTIPPLSDADWQDAFSKYQQIAQYKYLNSYFSLSDFKFIYFWEWFHRVWARLIGVVFIIPFIIFLVQKKFTKGMIKPLIGLFLLGGLQGLVGWIMVKSGLEDSELVYVSHFRLAIHFILALVVLGYCFLFALKQLVPEEKITSNKRVFNHSILILVLLLFQFIWGAFMAGLKAASSAPTWPTINGSWLPAKWLTYGDKTYTALSACFNNPLVVHFVHRTMAYLLVILIAFGSVMAVRQSQKGTLLFKTRFYPILLVSLQLTLGIVTVLISPWPKSFLWIAVSHQFVAMLLMLAYLWWAYISKKSIR